MLSQKCSDTADLRANTPFQLEYVPGSCNAVHKLKSTGVQLSDSIVTEGGAVIGDTTPTVNTEVVANTFLQFTFV